MAEVPEKGQAGSMVIIWDASIVRVHDFLRRIQEIHATIEVSLGGCLVAVGSHIGSSTGGYGEVFGGFDFGERNDGGTSLLDFASAFELVIVNSIFLKREEHLVTFLSMVAKTQIDYLLFRRYDRGLCEDCKVIPSENLTTQHRLLVMDVGILMKRKKRFVWGQSRIRWEALSKDNVQELEGRLTTMGAWKSGGDVSAIGRQWRTVNGRQRKSCWEF
ncbi:uncharacterized protein LOC107801888 [Nicotiana tabacum]|uniref:Craniofacial development protein 2-like n=1 Tax=Nicotiana tabacum TaxID=4097 RepID=A0A1S4AW12_TOBAC|nr:PREDICTED: craniofacial development protein 2-like [Nicotiana tabacum]